MNTIASWKNRITDRFNGLSDIQKKLYVKGLFVLFVFFLTIVLIFAATAAWYNNIAQVEELAFEIDAWGVDSTITIEDQSVEKAAPGDIGTIPYKIDNEADSLVNVQIKAAKKYLPEFMQKRIYFYVDKKVEVNGETLEKAYIHDDNAYSHVLLGGQNVDNTGDVASDGKIKWEWVYDLLGYYVVIETDDDDISKETAYIRPVQYTYEDAKYDNDTGALTSIKIDGKEVTAEDYIKNLLDTDGFETEEFKELEEIKTILKFKDISEEITEKTYYEVYTEDDYGVYLYICDFQEIAVNNRVDTDIGNKEEAYLLGDENYTVIQISCGQAHEYVVEMADAAQLYSIMSDKEAYTKFLTDNELEDVKSNVIFQLTQDMNLNTVTMFDGADFIIDLNGFTLSCAGPASAEQAQHAMFTLKEKSSLRIYNGNIHPGNYTPFAVTNSTLVAKEITFDHKTSTVRADNTDQKRGSNIQLVRCVWAEDMPQDVVTIEEINDEGETVQSFICIKEAESQTETQADEDTSAE
ncbi:MAG: hypothetical protein IJO54_04230 [Oscillospiraceae bacterium]|nr:hypothetical protein [Oscillospiraceae bacterium]